MTSGGSRPPVPPGAAGRSVSWPGWASARRPARRAGCPRPCRPSARAWRAWPSRGAAAPAGSGAVSSGWSPGSGSGSVTSSAAPAISAGVQGAAERVGVHDRPARGVDQVGGRLHAAQRLVADQPARLGRERGVQGHEVRALEQLLERHAAAAARVQDLAAEALEPARHGLPDAPEADDARRWRRAGRGRAAARAPRCATRRAARRRRPRPAGARSPSISATARSAVVSVSTPGVLPTGMPARGGRLEVDVVHADGVVRDRPQPRRRLDQLGVDRVGEQRQQPLELGRAREQLVPARRQLLGPHLDLVLGGEPVERAAGQPAGDEDPHSGSRHPGLGLPCRAGSMPEAAAIALVANPRLARPCDPDAVRRSGCARSEPRCELFEVGDAERAAAAGPDRLAVAGGDGSDRPAPPRRPAPPASRWRCSRPARPTTSPAAWGCRSTWRRPAGWPCAARPRAGDGARLDGRAPVRERGERRAARPGRPHGEGVEEAARPARLRGRRRRGGATAKPVPVRCAATAETLFDGDAWQVTVAASGAFGAGARIARGRPPRRRARGGGGGGRPAPRAGRAGLPAAARQPRRAPPGADGPLPDGAARRAGGHASGTWTARSWRSGPVGLPRPAGGVRALCSRPPRPPPPRAAGRRCPGPGRPVPGRLPRRRRQAARRSRAGWRARRRCATCRRSCR